MRTQVLLLSSTLALAACSAIVPVGANHPERSSDVVVVDRRGDDRGRGEERGNGRRSFSVPPGHYPPPGQCRVWYAGRPPGQQPRAARCGQLVGRVPLGAILLYNGRAWDTEHNWHRDEARDPGSVPVVVLRIMNSVRR